MDVQKIVLIVFRFYLLTTADKNSWIPLVKNRYFRKIRFRWL